MTVLFADLKDSLTYLAGSDPEDARELLDAVVGLLVTSVDRFGGTVSKSLGDGIMALFGAPVALEDHAARACHAALHMQASVREYSDRNSQAGQQKIQIRVGINSGEVIVREIDNDLVMDYSAIGEVTHLAARLEKIARPGTIFVTAATARHVDNSFDVKPRGLKKIKGLRKPVKIFEISGGDPDYRRFQRRGEVELTAFTGRRAELGLLRQALNKAALGHGQVVSLLGEPGIGKSRMVWELRNSAMMDDWTILETGCTPVAQNAPYAPLISLFKRFFDIKPTDSEPSIGKKISRKLAAVPALPDSSAEVFLALFGIEPADAAWNNLDAAQRRERTIDSIRTVLLRESRTGRLVFIIEDLHWIDTQSEYVVNRLVEALPACHCLLLVTFRPEYTHAWSNTSFNTRIVLDALPGDEINAMFDALLGIDDSLSRLREILAARTGGNPFFIEESIQSLDESGALAGVRGSYRAVGASANWPIPTTVHGVLAERIDRLGPKQKRILEAAAVIGRSFSLDILGAALGLDEEQAEQSLRQLQAAEMIYESDLPPDREYTFKHPLTHEVALATLLNDQKRSLHRGIVIALEELRADRLNEHVEMLALHAFEGQEWAKAHDYLHRSGLKALERSSNAEAVRFFERALLALGRLPKTAENQRKAIDLRFDIRTGLIPLGRQQELRDLLSECEKVARSSGDPERLGRTYAYLTQYNWLHADWDAAIRTGRKALSVSRKIGDSRIEGATTNYLGLAHFSLGDYRRAIECLQLNASAETSQHEHKLPGLTGLPSVLSRGWICLALAETGDFAAALRHAEAALEIAGRVGRPFDRIHAKLGLGGTLIRRGMYADALEPLGAALQECNSSNIPLLLPRVYSCLAQAYVHTGSVQNAVDCVARSIDMESRIGPSAIRSFVLLNAAEVCFLAANPDEAATYARKVLDRSRELREKGIEAYVLRLLGNMCNQKRKEGRRKAESYYDATLKRALAAGMRPLEAIVRFELAVLRSGPSEKAEADLHSARDLFKDMGMTSWSDRVRERCQSPAN